MCYSAIPLETTTRLGSNPQPSFSLAHSCMKIPVPRNKERIYRVIYSDQILRGIVASTICGFPKEVGGFLLGQYEFLGTGLWVITGFYPLKKVGTDSQISFPREQYMKAYKYSARRNLMLFGTYHSHPWERNPPFDMTHHSSGDAHSQEMLGETLSLIVGVTPDYWNMSTWKVGYNSSLREEIMDGKKRYALSEYLNKHTNDLVWGTHQSIAKSNKSS